MASWYDRNKHRYPADWPEIARRVKDEAGWTCQGCGAPHGPVPHILTVDHVVDHDPMNVAPENLAALCQRCHLRRQGMRPKPATKEDAIARLRARHETEISQMTLLAEADDPTVCAWCSQPVASETGKCPHCGLSLDTVPLVEEAV